MMKKLIVGMLAIGFSLVANADPVQLKFDGINTATATNVKINGTKQNVYIGSYNLVEKIGSATQSLVGFCVDPFEWASSSFTAYDKSPLDATDFKTSAGVVRADGAARMNNVQKLYDNAYATLGSDTKKTAGFHLALWEVFNDNTDLGSGAVKTVYSTDATVKSWAQTFLDVLAGWGVKNLYSLTMYASLGHWTGFDWCKTWVPGKQDFLVATLNPPQEVPLPAALPMLISGLLGLGLMGSRRKV